MRPTLFGGTARGEDEVFSEWALVTYGAGHELRRFDVVVVDQGGKDPIVKRVLGLPGESIRIVDGDVFIDGKRLGHDAARPPAVPVFDSSLHAVSDMQGYGFCVEQEPKGPWREEQGVWHLRGLGIGLGRDTGRSTGMMFYNPDVRDGYIDQNGKRIAGFRSVNDVILECGLAVDQLEDRLRLQLSEAGDLFEARLRPTPGGPASHVLELVRSRVGRGHATGPEESESIVAQLDVNWPMAEWVDVSFSNVDNCVSFRAQDLDIDLVFNYEANERFPGKAAVGDQNVGVRVGLGGEGLDARFRSIRVLRDLHYAPLDHGLGLAPPGHQAREEGLLYLGPGELFLLGDNSSQSIDSRTYGAVSAERVVGRPVAVVWPPSRWRMLR